MYSSFTEKNFVKIAMDRGIDPSADVYDETVVTKRERDLFTADLIYTSVLLRPSNTASLSQSHNGYQKTIGSETDVFQSRKIDYALAIYKKYNDEKYEILNGTIDRIKIVAIEDVMEV